MAGRRRRGDVVTESTLLVYACSVFFLAGPAIPWYWNLAASAVPVVGVGIIETFTLPHCPRTITATMPKAPPGWHIFNLLVLMIPSLLCMTFAFAGAVAWISRRGRSGQATGTVASASEATHGSRKAWRCPAGGRHVDGECPDPRAERRRLLPRLAALSLVGEGPGALTWITADLVNDTHWWIGDGIQWALLDVILVGAFAVLRTMRADARGVFFGPYPSDREDLTLMAALAGFIAIGTWGSYDGVSVPIPFIVAFVLLLVWGLTRKFSRLELLATVENDSGVDPPESLLGRYQNEILAASDHGSATATRRRKGSRLAAAAKSNGSAGALLQVIPLKSRTQAGVGAAGSEDHPVPELKLPWPVDPGVTALALGPGNTWWDNGVAAVKAGMYLTDRASSL